LFGSAAGDGILNNIWQRSGLLIDVPFVARMSITDGRGENPVGSIRFERDLSGFVEAIERRSLEFLRRRKY